MRTGFSRRLLLLLLLLLSLVSFTACSARLMADPLADSVATQMPGVDTVLPLAEDSEPLRTSSEAVLYFRYQDEPYLAQELRQVTQNASQTWEMALISQLLLGPGTASTELNALFPEGTRVLSTVKQGRTLFVTLSKEIMNAYPDEPADWEEQSDWKTEVPLRRQLCMQSLVATVTENCDVDQVQVLVQNDGGNVSSLRLRQNYFMDGSEDSVLVGPMTRDSTLLLTMDNTLELILDAWIHQDWERLYGCISVHDPETGSSRLSLREFAAKMDALPTVTSAEYGSASLSSDGICATYAVDFTVLESGVSTEWKNRVIRLYRDGGLWKTGADQLTGWLAEN